jgi:hypothetical protein
MATSRSLIQVHCQVCSAISLIRYKISELSRRHVFHISERDKKELTTVSYIMNGRIPVTRHIYNPPDFKEQSRCEPLIDTDIC